MNENLQMLNKIAMDIDIAKFYFIRMDSTGLVLLSSSDNEFLSQICHCDECKVVSSYDFIDVTLAKYPKVVFKFEQF